MIHKIIVIGADSDNLSVFALTPRINREDLLILERNDSIKWYHGMMIDSVTDIMVKLLPRINYFYLCSRNNKIKRNSILCNKLYFKEVNILNLTNAIGVK